MRYFLLLLMLLIVSGCNTIQSQSQTTPISHASHTFPVNTWLTPTHSDDEYLEKVQPIFSKRCVTCHGCDESPCQLNMQSYQGVRRGYNPIPVYDMDRLKSTPVTNMNMVYSLEKWRNLGFLPVVANDDELEETDQAKNWNQSLLMSFINKGMQFNHTDFAITDAVQQTNTNFSYFNKHQCTATDYQYEDYFKSDNPWEVQEVNEYFAEKGNSHGMPFALPALNANDFEILQTWMRNGARGPSAQAMQALAKPSKPQVIAKWEQFLNIDSAQARHAARYIYEHTYTAYWHFDESPKEYFRIARVINAGTDQEQEIITQYPYQLPQHIKPEQFSYRLKKATEVIVQKKMTLWPLNDERLARLKKLFLSNNWPDKTIPEPVYISNNPFEYFSVIPTEVRSRFLMENARTIIGAMVQGSVCVGSGATYAIRDHFWVWFLKPESDVSVTVPKLGLDSWDAFGTGRNEDDIEVYSKDDSLLNRLWHTVQTITNDANAVVDSAAYYVETNSYNEEYLEAYERQLRLWLQEQNRYGLSIDDIWDGNDSTGEINPNAWLSITRHEQSATVQQGAAGGLPGSVWVLSFSNFERIYYNLVVNYNPYGNLAMKISSYRLMSYSRLEAEDLAISFLPMSIRDDVRQRYTSGLAWIIRKNFFDAMSLKTLKSGQFELPPRVTGTPSLKNIYNQSFAAIAHLDKEQAKTIATNKVVDSLLNAVKTRLQAIENSQMGANSVAQKNWETRMQTEIMHKTKQDSVDYPPYFPNIAYLRVKTKQGAPWVYSLIVDRAFSSNVFSAFNQQERDPKKDVLTFYQGFVGAYPSLFFDIDESQRFAFIEDTKNIKTQVDWEQFIAKYAIARNSAEFWPFFDWIHGYKQSPHFGVNPVEQGIIDVGQYKLFSKAL